MIIALLAAGISYWNAVSAKGSAKTAQDQLDLMREQWAVAQADAEEQAKPKVRLEVEHMDVGSFITLVNQGQDVVHIDNLTIGGVDIPYLQMRWNAVALPKLSTIPPGEKTMLVLGIGKVMFNGTHMNNFVDWAELKIIFTHGTQPEPWALTCEVQLPEGQFKMRNLKINPEPIST